MTHPSPSIALYTYSTLPRGSVVHTAALAEALVAAGWDATVYALDKDGRGFYRSLHAPLCLVPAAPTPDSTAELVRVRRVELAAYVAARSAERAHDIHHAEDCLTASALLDLRAAGHTLRVARTVHHVEHFEDPYLAACQERSIREADLCFAVSAAAERDLAGGFAVPAARVSNGVALERWCRVDPGRVQAWRTRLQIGTGPVVLAVGGVEARKNTVRILQAFADLHHEQPRAQLVLLGGASVLDHGAARAAFVAALCALPPATRAAVTELGVVPDPDVPALFRLADVLVLPSLHEGFGLVALEALAAGLPLVASNQAPFTEYLDDSCATLVDPLSHAAIAAGLRRALHSSIPQRAAARRRAEHHSWQRVAELHMPHYHNLIREPRAHARDALRCSLV